MGLIKIEVKTDSKYIMPATAKWNLGEKVAKFHKEPVRHNYVDSLKPNFENSKQKRSLNQARALPFKAKTTSTNFCGPAIKCNEFAAWD